MNHPEAWCVSQITLRCNTYTNAHAIAIMKKSSRTDGTYPLATQLIAAKLNAGCAHTDSSCVAGAAARLRIDGCVRIRLGAMSRRAVPPGNGSRRLTTPSSTTTRGSFARRGCGCRRILPRQVDSAVRQASAVVAGVLPATLRNAAGTAAAIVLRS